MLGGVVEQDAHGNEGHGRFSSGGGGISVAGLASIETHGFLHKWPQEKSACYDSEVIGTGCGHGLQANERPTEKLPLRRGRLDLRGSGRARIDSAALAHDAIPSAICCSVACVVVITRHGQRTLWRKGLPLKLLPKDLKGNPIGK